MSTDRQTRRVELVFAATIAATMIVVIGWLAWKNRELEQRLIVHEARLRYLSRLEDTPYTDAVAISLKSGDERDELKERLDARYQREARYKYFMEPLGFPLPSERSPALHVGRIVAGRRR